jgi:alkylhydroperoxidase family enzyme
MGVDFRAAHPRPIPGGPEWACSATLGCGGNVPGRTGPGEKPVVHTDEQLVDAVHCICYFNFINRVLDGLGVES